ncbi:MAG: type 4a pilus biogenesis protein PilO [Gammaproteobacteria bacterium]|nr:type 4a pilus biogenesis protein PilO [Gammaproteobacteria bacterium]NNJ91527.1 type 4a pilus biogenesis protein PilO [Gammaproteobacteria bacterium]
MNLEELNDLDLTDLGEMPFAVKLVIILIVCLGIGAGVYYYDIQKQFARLDKARAQESELKRQFEDKQAKAVNLESYKQQLKEMEDTFGAMLRQLPDKTEVPDLLVDVSQTGLAAGLEFKLFKPLGESPREFYAELPISIEVEGTYHEFGEFISGIAALPRIVTMHDIQITPMKKENATAKGGVEMLSMKATAKTYRYLEEDNQ